MLKNIENEKLIGNFMKMKIDYDKSKFYSSWDWLIPVCEEACRHTKNVKCAVISEDIRFHVSRFNMDLAYKDLIRFIKEYNKQKQS